MSRSGFGKALAISLTLAAAAAPGALLAAKETASPVIARVNGEDVSKAEFDEVLRANRRFFDLTQDSVRQKLHGQRLEEFLFDHEVVAIRAQAQQHAADLPGMKATIEQAAARIKGGEDFATVAQEMSQDGSAANGGLLGSQQSFEDFVHPFNRVALSLKEGEVSDPLLTIFGYHIIKVEKIYPPMEGKPKRVDLRHILIRYPGDPRNDAEQARAAAKVEIVDDKYCKKLPSYCPED